MDDLLGKTTLNYNNFNSDIEWTEDDFNKAKRDIQNLYKHCIINNKELELKDSNPELTKMFQDCFNIRQNEILQKLLKENIIKKGHNLVENIDWRLKWIMGSSSLATIREPLLQVDLHCSKYDVEQNMSVNNTVNFEANLEQVNNLIEELTNITKELSELD